MTENLRALFDRAREARARAYAPYSRFPVGAALRTESGAIHAGANVENAAYPLGMCAEAAAIAAMISAGERSIKEILVLGPQRIPPCGACRQRISEFAKGSVLVYLSDDSGACVSYTMAELLPHPFHADDLNPG